MVSRSILLVFSCLLTTFVHQSNSQANSKNITWTNMDITVDWSGKLKEFIGKELCTSTGGNPPLCVQLSILMHTVYNFTAGTTTFSCETDANITPKKDGPICWLRHFEAASPGPLVIQVQLWSESPTLSRGRYSKGGSA
uniref:Uncharacterized protein n=1 Tax=Cacopsylla melanoneura TaxID=428564 RepID=A0A8D8R579_9HEMI